MKNPDRQQKRILAALLLVPLFAVPGGRAAGADTTGHEGWRIRFFAAAIDFDNHANGDRSWRRASFDLDAGFGLGVNAEYRFSRRLGLDVGILGGAAIDAAWRTDEAGAWFWSGFDTLTFTPLSVGLDIHLTPNKDVDLYVGPMLAWIHYGGLVIYSGSDWAVTAIDFDEELGAGATIGIAVPIGERQRWSFNANLIHLESRIESRWGVGDLLAGDYSATLVGLGAGYRF